MKKIGIFYGTNTGKTEAVVDEIEFNLKKFDYETINVKNGIEKIKEFENIIMITPSYGVGEPQEDWVKNLEELKKINFQNKKIALVGLGNQFAFGESFVGGMKVLYDIVKENKGEVIGLTSSEGYSFQESEAVINDKFIGLALDENYQDNETPDRIYEWMNEIKKYFF